MFEGTDGIKITTEARGNQNIVKFAGSGSGSSGSGGTVTPSPINNLLVYANDNTSNNSFYVNVHDVNLTDKKTKFALYYRSKECFCFVEK